MLTFKVEHFAFFLTTICIVLGRSWASELSDSIQSILDNPLIHSNIPEDGKLGFCETATKYGYKCTEYDVTTKDGYILKLFYIPGQNKKDVLLMHGISDSADSFQIRIDKSLVFTLVDAGHGVWAGNTRGNKYSIEHNSLNPDVDPEYWDFSFHKIAMFDLPAIIDFVLEKTNQTKLNIVGHSQGTTIHFALLSEKPEYNDKINVFIALAPVCFMNNVEIKIIVDLLKLVPNYDNALTETFYKQGILRENGPLRTILEVVCTQKGIGYDICAYGILFPAFGFDPEGIERGFLSKWILRYPTSTSVKSLVHFVQVIEREKFSQFDYGEFKNQELYGSASPPDYDLSKITASIALLVAKNDKLSTIPDVEFLESKLTNAKVMKYIMPRDEFNHLSFVAGQFMKDELFPQIFDILKNYS